MPWLDCEVTATGPREDGAVFIGLKAIDGSLDGGRWFKAFPGMQKEMLATALCAMGTGMLVRAGLSDLTESSVIERLYILQGGT